MATPLETGSAESLECQCPKCGQVFDSPAKPSKPYCCHHCGTAEAIRVHLICFGCIRQLTNLKALAKIVRDRFGIAWDDDYVSIVKRGLNALVDLAKK